MTLTIHPYSSDDRVEWDAFLAGSPTAHFAQRTSWKNLIERQYGFASSYWLARQDGQIVGILPLFRRGAIGFSAPGGLIARTEETATKLIEVARDFQRDHRLKYVEFRDQKMRWGDLPTSTEHCTMVLDLPKTEEDLWKNISGTLRNEVRKSQKNGLATVWDRRRTRDFYEIYSENMRDLGTPARSHRYYADAIASLADDADLLFVERESVPIATMLLVAQSGTWCDPWASGLRRFFSLRPNQLMYWEAVKTAVLRGFGRFDFGRSQWDSGTYRFKAQWGAKPVPLYYQYLLAKGVALPSFEAQKRSFAWASAAWKRMPLPAARALGEPIRRLLTEVL